MAVAPFPFETLPRLSLSGLALSNAAVAWLGAVAQPALGARLRALGLEVAGWRLASVTRRTLDSSAGLVWLLRDGERALLSIPGELVRAQAARLLVGPKEISAPRALTAAEHAVAAMLCASALTGAGGASPSRSVSGISVETWQPFPDVRGALAATDQRVAAWPCLELAVEIESGAGPGLDGREHLVRVWVPPSLVHRRPLRRPAAPWLDEVIARVPLLAATAPLDAELAARLEERDVIVVEPCAELRFGRGAVAVRFEGAEAAGLGRFGAGATRLVIESGYRRRVPSAIPASSSASAASSAPSIAASSAPSAASSSGDALDDVTAELTVTLGSVALSLRQLTELSVGQVLSLGRPLAGPFELQLGGKSIGRGELVDVEGSLGVRVISLATQ